MMKKLYRKGTVHPSPPPPPVVSDHLSFLPAALFTLAAALSPDDREVLAYLLLSNSNSNSNSNTGNVSSHHGKQPSSSSPAAASPQRSCLTSKTDHPPMFRCDCFRCYKSYWVRWDSSPSRQLIHDIIDKFEEKLEESKNTKGSNTKTKKERRKQLRTREKADSGAPPPSSSRDAKGEESGGSLLGSAGPETSDGGTTAVSYAGEVADEGAAEKGSVRRLVSFIGDRIWGVWN